jgi:hypothetical protein
MKLDLALFTESASSAWSVFGGACVRESVWQCIHPVCRCSCGTTKDQDDAALFPEVLLA